MIGSIAACTRGYVTAKRLQGAPVVIGGCERSGTTLLTAIVSAHPNVHTIHQETWALCYGRAAGFDSDDPIRPRRLYRFLGNGRPKAGASRWAEKSPANVFYFDRIREHFGGRVHLVHIVRDGRDVVTSEHPRKPGKPWTSVRRWKWAAGAGLAHLDDPDVLTIRYRDLILDFRSQVERLCDFIDAPLTPEIVNWHDHATVRASQNLNGGRVPKLHTGSLRKFERADCKHVEQAEALMEDPEAVDLLDAYKFAA